MPKYKIGDVVYYAKCSWLPVQKLCEVCYGKKEVTLILGNDDTVVLPCEFCKKGFNAPLGYVEEYEFVTDPDIITITTIEITVTESGEEVEYRSGCRCFEEKMLFETRAEALTVGEGLRQQLISEQETRTACIKKDKNKSFSWNAGYHLKAARKHREQIVYHEKMARVFKSRSREGGSDE